MTKDNASGAGMELPKPLYKQWGTGPGVFSENMYSESQVRSLLAESQAHNAKLEAQVERLRQALVECIEDLDYLSKAPDSAYARPDDTTIANAMRALKP